MADLVEFKHFDYRIAKIEAGCCISARPSTGSAPISLELLENRLAALRVERADVLEIIRPPLHKTMRADVPRAASGNAESRQFIADL